MKAISLYKKYSIEQLVKIDSDIRSDPKNRESKIGSIFIYNKKTRGILSQIAWAITMHMADKRSADGDPVVSDGYSGRQTNRR